MMKLGRKACELETLTKKLTKPCPMLTKLGPKQTKRHQCGILEIVAKNAHNPMFWQ